MNDTENANDLNGASSASTLAILIDTQPNYSSCIVEAVA